MTLLPALLGMVAGVCVGALVTTDGDFPAAQSRATTTKEHVAMKPCDISKILGRMEADELNNLDAQVREVVRAVQGTGQKGSVTLTINLKRNSDQSVQYDVSAKTKVPKPAAGARIAFFAFDDNLQPTGELSDLPHKQEPLFGGNVAPIRPAKQN